MSEPALSREILEIADVSTVRSDPYFVISLFRNHREILYIREGTMGDRRITVSQGFFSLLLKSAGMQITDHTFLITGGSSGLGAACARRFVQQGANVVLADLQKDLGERLAAELGSRAEFVEMDVTQEESVKPAIEKAVGRFSKIDGLISCAGILAGQRVVSRQGPHDLQLFSQVVQVNLIGTFNVLRLVAVKMAENEPNQDGERGVIINTASISAAEGQIGQAAYAASKGAVAAMTVPIARELAERGIRVVAISPGVFRTEMIDALPEKLSESLESQTMFPARLGKPDEFAAMAQHIVENPMLNSTIIRLDGGMRMGAK